jgi:tetratricopeptide (TPR) repeat protein
MIGLRPTDLWSVFVYLGTKIYLPLVSRIAALLLTLSFFTARSQDSTAIMLTRLNHAIELSASYDSAKYRSIQHLRMVLTSTDKNNLPARFDGCLRLYEEYKVFNYDSAFTYARQLQATALQLGDPVRTTYARLKLGFCLLSSGLFKETLDSLQKISIHGAPDSLQAEYYALMGRFYYDLGDFDNDAYNTPDYIRNGNAYIDSALRLYPPGSFNYSYYLGLRQIKSGQRAEAVAVFRKLLRRPDLTLHQLAVTTSTLSDIYITNGHPDTAITLLIEAANADIQSSTKETAAIFNLAQLLYKKGDVRNASSYIEVAIRDAVFYGARQRKVQVSAILPLIEGEKVARVEEQKTIFVNWSIIATFLLLVVIVLAITVFRQVNRLKAAQRIITEAHIKEQAINQRLLDTNSKLSEANKIKEEYIGYFFNADSESFEKIEKFKKALEQKIAYRKWDDIITLVKGTNLKKEREELLRNFDKVFLKLFPEFIQRFNDLFPSADKIDQKDQEFLNTDLRIFALIRMGIHENEKIARILEYSVNTINTYKTRIKNRSLVPNEEFEQRIMEIKSA